MAVAILLESALAFLRLSDPNVASWGNLIGLGRDVLRVQWYVSAIPGIAILVTVLAVSLVGQGLNDARQSEAEEPMSDSISRSNISACAFRKAPTAATRSRMSHWRSSLTKSFASSASPAPASR